MEPHGRHDEIRRVARQLVAEGPLTFAALFNELDRRNLLEGVLVPESDDVDLDLVDLILGFDDDLWIDHELIVSTSRVLANTQFTHEVSSWDLERSMVAVSPDLEALNVGVPGTLLVPGGGEVEMVFRDDSPDADEHGSWRGPPGWLDHLGGATLASFRREGAYLVVEPVTVVTVGAQEVDAIRQLGPAHVNRDVGTEALPILMNVLIRDARLFIEPVPPLGDLMRAAGFERRDVWFGLAGTPWLTPSEDHLAHVREDLLETHGFAECCLAAFDAVVETWLVQRRIHISLDAATAERVGAALHHGEVSEAFAEYALGRLPLSDDELERFGRDLSECGPPAEGPGHYLLAMNAERDGATELAESHLRIATLLDPDYGSALRELAWYVADRGRARDALELLRRADVPRDDPEIALLTMMSRPVGPSAGRNDPCPCGSGRKYKQCCLTKATLSMEQRAGWLHHKLELFAMRPQRCDALASALELIETDVDDVLEVAGDVVLAQVAHDPATIDRFLVERGVLLPDDEREHLERWRASRLALYEVVERQAGRSLTLRDSRTADRVTVMERAASRELSEGAFIMARVVPAGDVNVMVGPVMRITLAQRASLLELLDLDPGPLEVAGWLSDAFQPPTLLNREGELLEMWSLSYDVASWKRVTATLNKEFESSGAGVWLELFDLGEEQIIRATLRREGDRLLVEANSRRRAQRMQESLSRLLPELVLVGEGQRDLYEMALEEGATDRPATRESIEPSRRELERVAQAYIEKVEREWIEERIPALGGLTLLEALDDPTRREDLLALLSEFDQRAGRLLDDTGMSANRIRVLLGLPTSIP